VGVAMSSDWGDYIREEHKKNLEIEAWLRPRLWKSAKMILKIILLLALGDFASHFFFGCALFTICN
jgi:hypothetical protein